MPYYMLQDGYDYSKKNPRRILVRDMSFEEARNLSTGSHAEIKSRDSKLRRVRIGRVKTWKTRPDEVEIGVKYGMYEYATFTRRSDGVIGNDVAKLVVRVNEEEHREA